MSVILWAAVLLVLFLVVAKVFSSLAKTSKDLRDTNAFRRVAQTSLFVAIFAPVVILMAASYVSVPSGHIGVVTEFGQVQERTLDEGAHLVKPWASVEKMSLQVQKNDDNYHAATLDMQAVHVHMAINFRLIPNRASEVYQKIGVQYAQVIIGPAAQEVLKAETAKHKASEILQKRQQIKADVQRSLGEWLSKYGLELKEISISNVGFDPDYTKAIEQKQIQEQRAEQKEYELQQAKREAEIRQASAKGEADAIREQAKGRADSLKIEADALAEYNKKVSESLSPILVQNEYLKRWDGRLPQYMMSSGGILFQIPVEPKK